MTLAEGLLAKAGESFVKDVYGAIKDKAVKKWQTFNWYTAQGNYFKEIEDEYGTTRILGNPEPIPLEGIFTDVFLLDMPTAYKRFNILQLQNEPKIIKNEQNRLSGLDLVKRGKLHRLYILGKPGAGKTTFLKYVALKAAQQEIRKIPIFVSLKEWADSEMELMPFLVKQFDICHFPEAQPLIEYILEIGLAIVLFDGLDETQQEGGKRDKIINDIRDFSRKYENSQILLTCRIAATDYTFEKFTYLEVADFTEEQVSCYVEKWFAYDDKKQKQFKDGFARDENKRLREMASTPLLLSLLCLNFEQTGYFPQRRVDIYEEGINALLTKWDASRNIRRDEIYKGLELGRKRQMFARIAAQTFEKNEYFLPKNKLIGMIVDYLSQLPNSIPKDDIDGEAILKAIEAQHSIFVERAHDIYSFSHLSFQEYFTSKYIVDNAAKGTLKKLLLVNNVIDNRWREVILNTASLLDEADSFFDIMQKTINSIVRNNIQIKALLNWAELKAKTIETNNRVNVRSAYLYINSFVDFVNLKVLDFTTESLKSFPVIPGKIDFYNLDFSLKLFVRNIRIINIVNNFHISLDYQAKKVFLHSDRDIDLDNQVIIIYLFSLILCGKKGINNNKHPFLKNFYKILVENSKNIDKKFYTELKKLKLPSLKNSKDTWIDFNNKFLLLSQKHRNLPYLSNFNEANYKLLFNYANATELLVDCLNLAVVENRQDIENKLLFLD